VDYETVSRVLAALEREGVRYAIFGAAALNLHGLARFTEDLGLFVEPDPDNIERLKQALRAVFDDPHIDEISADDLLGDYPAVQYVPPDGAFHVDILTSLATRSGSPIWRLSACVSANMTSALSARGCSTG
jgi:hypothetical protein